MIIKKSPVRQHRGKKGYAVYEYYEQLKYIIRPLLFLYKNK